MALPLIPDRYELKYVIPLEAVDEVRARLLPFCELDKHSARSPDRLYAIHSIYLDTSGRDLYRVSREGRASRFKVRIRRYGTAQGPTGPVFLEVKRKASGFVRKSRAQVPVEGWVERMRGAPASDASPNELGFRRELDRLALEPVTLMRYEREAWFSRIDGYARVTFDHRMLCQPAHGFDFDADPRAWVSLDDAAALKRVPRGVLLELKCTRDVPRWMVGLVRSLELRRTGFSKYCTSVERLYGFKSPASLLSLEARWS